MSSTNSFSDWLITNLGVPQGSVLGPLLFIAYISDLKEVLPTGRIKRILYADDLQIYVQTKRQDLCEAIRLLSDAAKLVEKWVIQAGLRLNAGKTQAIILGSAHNIDMLSQNVLPCIEMEKGVRVPFVGTVQNLGVILDSKFTWKPHINLVSSKVNRVLYSLSFFRSSTTEALRKQLGSALVTPHLDYCSSVYYDVPVEQLAKLQRLQNVCVRYVTGAKRDEHITPYRKQLCWLNVPQRRMYFCLLTMYKIVNRKAMLFTRPVFEKHQQILREN